MKGIYGEETPVTRGKKDTYAVMDLDYISPGEAIVSVDSYIIEVIDEFPRKNDENNKIAGRKPPFKGRQCMYKIMRMR